MDRPTRNIVWILKVIAGTLAFVCAYLILTGKAWSQTFPLNKPIPEESVYCFTQRAAEDIVNAGENSEVIFLFHARTGECIIAKAVVVYSRRVFQKDRYKVYEGRIGNTQVFAPTTYTAIGESEL